MAVDTATKRYSALNVSAPWRGPAAIPSGTIGDSIRAVVAWLYSGFDYAGDDGGGGPFGTSSGQARDSRSRLGRGLLKLVGRG